jgi:hypothetical protein
MLYIWVRKTTEWADEQTFLAQVRPDLMPAVAIWNETFEMRFHIFRDRVREIARLNLSRVENALCASWEEIPEGSLVVPIDDDDWFAPDLAAVLESEHDPDARGYHWISSWVEVPIDLGHRLSLLRRAILPRTAPKWICTTNNYALFKGPRAKELLTNHMDASAWVTEREPGEVKRIGQRLSVANRTLGSRTSLRPHGSSVTRTQLIRRFHRYKALYRNPQAVQPAWCRPYVAMMADLMDELGLRAG